jgi:hypothetical protein
MKTLFLSPALIGAILLTNSSRADVTLKDLPGKVRVEIDGQLVTEYCYQGADHVYFHPLIGSGGAPMTRSWPMEEAPDEEHDHPHHRSLWFAHGMVNGVDFWSEAASNRGKNPPPLGKIVHREFIKKEGGKDRAILRDRLEWVAPDGTALLSSEQQLTVHQPKNETRILDFEVQLKANQSAITLGDTKEGSMAIRIAESMRMSAPAKKPGLGHILASSGKTDGDVWGTRAEWVDMYGPVAGKTVGIAMLDHPKNPRHPTRWHARSYGLFAANPFCEHEMDKSQPKDSGALKLEPGQSITFRYRIVLHPDAPQPSLIQAEYESFRSTP